MNEQTSAPAPGGVRSASGSGVRRGCSFGCLLILLVIGAGLYFGCRHLRQKYTADLEQFERAGYARIDGEVIEVTDPVLQPTLYVARVVRIQAGSTRNIAFFGSQKAEIHGTVEGDVHFYGQKLIVHKDAHLKQDLYVFGQVAQIAGQVDGEIKGTYQAVERPPTP